MKIGLIGAGFIGRALAMLAIRNGDEAMISNSRDPRTLLSAARSIHARVGTPEEAAAFGDIVVLAVPFQSRASLPAAALDGKIVVDAINYYPERDGAIAELDGRETTTSAMVASLLPGARVVKAFNSILANDLERGGQLAGGRRRALAIASDDAEAKAVVTAFQQSIGFDGVDAGGISDSWRFERGKPLYCVAFDRIGVEAALAAARRDEELPVPRAEPPPFKARPGTPPDWVTGFFDNIDAKTYGAGFDFLTEDAHLRFGVHDVRGRDTIIAELKKFDDGLDTAHRVLDYWDGGVVKFLRGEVTMTPHDGSPAQTPAFCHVWYMEEGSDRRVCRIWGAAGPLAE